MPDLFPDIEFPDVETALAREQKQGYYPAPKFDIETGDFVRDSSNKIMTATGVEAWVLWCYKVLQTTRFTCLAYGSDIGVEIETLIGFSDRQATETALTREITEALLADPLGRTDYIENIAYEWAGTDVTATVTVVGINGDTAEVSATYPTAA